jgi:hypothetical protein
VAIESMLLLHLVTLFHLRIFGMVRYYLGGEVVAIRYTIL